MTDRQYYPASRPSATTSLLQKLRDHAPDSPQLVGLATLVISGCILTATVLALIFFAPLIIISSLIWVPAGFLIFVAVTSLLGVAVAAGSWIYARDYEKWLMETSNEIERPGFGEVVPPVSTTLNLRLFVGTWNVGGKTPPDDLNINDWINTKTPAHIYVFGFQEIVPLNAGNVLGCDHYGPAATWLSLISHSLNGDSIIINPASKQQSSVSSFDSSLHEYFEDNLNSSSSSCSSDEDSLTPTTYHGTSQHKYCLVASKQMVGLFLCLWVRQDLNQYIRRLRVSCVGRGIMKYLGNKGSISISMTLHQTTFCFVCTHLASGEKERDENRRNLDVAKILKRTKFSYSKRNPRRPTPPYGIMDHDNIIWLGDLNYRLASISGDTYEILERNDWQSLLEKDQLRIEQKEGRVFQGWEEGDIYFAPTYKYISNSDDYVFQTCSPKEKCQAPAWCDRILWKGEGLKQLSYFVGESRISDHRPVYSVFAVTDGKDTSQ